jgi:intracellular sulfur oxidation DsrE/DsrF family protein
MHGKTFAGAVLAVTLVLLQVSPALGEGYEQALKGVEQVKAVFDVSQGSPKVANVVFRAVKNVYEEEAVTALQMPPQVAVVFHGPAVKIITSGMDGFTPEEVAEIKTFQAMVKEMAGDGVRFEVCDYALKVMGVDPATVIPEIHHVGNGFVSVVGYQAQGYGVVRVP